MLILYSSIYSNLILREKELYWSPCEKLHLLACCILMKSKYLVFVPISWHRADAPHKGSWMMGVFGFCRDGGSLQTASVLGLGSRKTKPGFQGWNVQPQPQPTRRGEAIEIKSSAIGHWIQWIMPMQWSLPKSAYTSGFRKFQCGWTCWVCRKSRDLKRAWRLWVNCPYLALGTTPILGFWVVLIIIYDKLVNIRLLFSWILCVILANYWT